MKGNELIEKILNKEIKSGTMIKMKSNYPGLEWEKELSFNGNWFSEGKYEPGCHRYDDIILHLCDKYTTFEIIEDKKDKKLDKRDFLGNETLEQVDADLDFIIDKINEILDYLEGIEKKDS